MFWKISYVYLKITGNVVVRKKFKYFSLYIFEFFLSVHMRESCINYCKYKSNKECFLGFSLVRKSFV